MKKHYLFFAAVIAVSVTACNTFPELFNSREGSEEKLYGVPLLPEKSGHVLNIENIESSGVKAWLVEDNRVPVIDVRFSFKKGSVYDTAGKEGTADLVAATLNEGAGNLNSEAFRKMMTDKAIAIYFDASHDYISGHMRCTRSNLETALGLLKLTVLEPRFDAEAVARMKNEMISGLRYRQGNPGWHAGKAMREKIFEGHVYARPGEGTEESIGDITVEDMRKFKDAAFTKDTLKIGITGNISEDEAEVMLDKVFALLPDGKLALNIPEATLQQKGKIITVPWDGPQTYLLAVQSGISRNHPDWFAAQIINYALGGGSFNSRLMEEVRVKTGLTYGISSYISDRDYAPLWMIQTDVDNSGVEKTMDIIRNEWRKVRDNGISDKELADAKAFIIGALPLSLDSTESVSSLLVQMQNNNLPINYLDKRTDIINSVTGDNIKRVAKTLLKPDELTFILAGNGYKAAQH